LPYRNRLMVKLTVAYGQSHELHHKINRLDRDWTETCHYGLQRLFFMDLIAYHLGLFMLRPTVHTFKHASFAPAEGDGV